VASATERLRGLIEAHKRSAPNPVATASTGASLNPGSV
jgi:hypothetical protein